MSKKKVFITLGVILIAASLILTGYNIFVNYSAGKKSEKAVKQLEEIIVPFVQKEPVITEDGEIDTSEIEYPDYTLFPKMDMPTEKIDGEKYIGILSIDTLGLSLPVMSDWNYTKLREAPCRYTGSAYLDDLVIVAHNFDNHFGRLLDLKIDDVVTFMDIDGNLFSYRVGEVEILQPTEIDRMINSDWDLTLFTCNFSGQARVTVRCEKIVE